MAMAPMQQDQNAPVESTEGETPEQEPSGVSVELFIADSGQMTISVEQNDSEEGEGQDIPVKDLNEALAKIKQIASALLEQTMAQAPDAQVEDQAYKQEMAGGM